MGKNSSFARNMGDTEQVLNVQEHGTDALNITNHNNARTSWDLLDKGKDVLAGAEFTVNLS